MVAFSIDFLRHRRFPETMQSAAMLIVKKEQHPEDHLIQPLSEYTGPKGLKVRT